MASFFDDNDYASTGECQLIDEFAIILLKSRVGLSSHYFFNLYSYLFTFYAHILRYSTFLFDYFQ